MKTRLRCISKTHTTPLRGIHTPGERVPTFWDVEFSSEHAVHTLTLNGIAGIKAAEFNVGMVYDLEVSG
jgi:hypothetical protein